MLVSADTRGRGRRLAVVVVALLVLLTCGLTLSPPSRAEATPTTVSYHPSFASPTMVQTFEIQGNVNTPGGDGTYRLSDGTHTTEPVHYQADLPILVGALEDAGFVVADAWGGSGSTTGPGVIRWTVTFGVDPGVLLFGQDIRYGRLAYGQIFVGKLTVDCVFCLDLHPPTGTPNGAAVVVVHPGALTTGSKDWVGLDDMVDPFAAAGYTVAVINHRLGSPPPGGGAACEIDTVFPLDSPCDRYVRVADEAAADLQMATEWLTTHAASLGLTPGQVGAIGVSSGGTVVAHSLYLAPTPGHRRPRAGISVGGALRDTAMTPGAPPLLLGAFTADLAIVFTGTDTYQEAQEAVARARALANRVEVRVWIGPGHIPELHTGVFLGNRDTVPEYEDLVAEALAFFGTDVLGTTPARPVDQWYGAPAPYRFNRPAATQRVFLRPTEDVRPIRGDFDGNGLTDVLWYGAGAAFDTLWLGRSDGTFADALEFQEPGTGALGYFPAVSQPGTFATAVVGDVDGNGRDDVLFADGGPTTVLWCFGSALGSPPTVSTRDAPTAGGTPVLADVDGDGADDVLWPGTGTTAGPVWFGDAGGAFVDGGPLAVTVPDPAATAEVGDFDGDGRTDVLWPTRGSTPERMWWGTSREVPVTEVAVAVPGTSWDTGQADHVEVGDVDGDGRADIIAVANGLPLDVVVRGTADRVGTRQPFGWLGTATPIVADVDGDGRSDIFWHAPAAPIAALWVATASGFAPTTVASQPGTPLTGRFNGYPGSLGRDRIDLLWVGP